MLKYYILRFILIIAIGGVADTVNAQILITGSGDTLKGNIKRLTERFYNSDYTVKTIYTWDTVMKTIVGRIYDEHDIQKGKRVFKYNDAGRILERYFYCNDNELCEKDISKYDVHGYELERRICQYYSSSQQYPGNCNKLKEWIYNMIGEWESNIDSAISTHTYKYDNRGNQTEHKYQDISVGEGYTHCSLIITNTSYYPNNKIATTKKITTYSCDGDADTVTEQIVYKYDTKGNLIAENSTTIKQYRTLKSSIATTYKYNADNKLIEEVVYCSPAYITTPDHPGTRVGWVYKYSYNKEKNMESRSEYEIYRQSDGSEQRYLSRKYPAEKEQKEEIEYDKQGNVIKKTRNGLVESTNEIEYY